VTNFTYIFAPCISCGQTVRYTAQLGLLGFASSQYVVKKKNRRLGVSRSTQNPNPKSRHLWLPRAYPKVSRHLWLPRANYDVPSSVVASC